MCVTNEYLNNKMFEALIQRYQKAQRDKAKYELIMEDLQSSGGKKAKKPAVAQAFLHATGEHKKIEIEMVAIQHQLTTEFYKLSENIVRYAKFSLIDQDDAIQEGVMICLEKVGRFDPNKGRAFNYMTTCILNHFRQLYRSARNFNELKKRYHEFLSATMDDIVCTGRRGDPKCYNDQSMGSPG